MIESLEVEADGSATLTVGVERQEHEFRLREAELERLERELAAADFDAVDQAPGDSLCADCFDYTVEHEGEALTIDDLDQPAPALQTLLGHLSVIVADNYPPDVPVAQSGA